MLRNEKGSTLIMVLITFAVVTILGSTLLAKVSYSQRESINQIDNQKAYYYAKSVLETGIGYFEDETTDANLKQKMVDGKNIVKYKVNKKDSSELWGEFYVSDVQEDQITITAEGKYKDAVKKLSAILNVSKEDDSLEDGIFLAAERIEIKENSNILGGIYKANNDFLEVFNSKVSNIKMTLNKGYTHIYDSEIREELNVKSLGEVDINNINVGGAAKLICTEGYVHIYNSSILTNLEAKAYTDINSTGGSISVGGDASFISETDKVHIFDSEIKGETKIISGKEIQFQRNVTSIAWLVAKGGKVNLEKSSVGKAHVYTTGDIEPVGADYESINIEDVVVNIDEDIDFDGAKYEKIEQIFQNDKVIERPNSDEYEKVIYSDSEWRSFEEYESTSANSSDIRLVYVNSEVDVSIGNPAESKIQAYYLAQNNKDTIVFIGGKVKFKFNKDDKVENIYVYAPSHACTIEGMPKFFSGFILASAVKITGNEKNIESQFIGKQLPGFELVEENHQPSYTAIKYLK